MQARLVSGSEGKARWKRALTRGCRWLLLWNSRSSLPPSSMGLCITGCYHHAWLSGSPSPLADILTLSQCSCDAYQYFSSPCFAANNQLTPSSEPTGWEGPNSTCWLYSWPCTLQGPDLKSQLHSVTWLCDLDIRSLWASTFLFVKQNEDSGCTYV